MTTNSSHDPASDPRAPFGTQPRRSIGPLVLLGILYVGWFLVLLWMAAFESGN
jgi:purine-cytosine permease-like protein